MVGEFARGGDLDFRGWYMVAGVVEVVRLRMDEREYYKKG